MKRVYVTALALAGVMAAAGCAGSKAETRPPGPAKAPPAVTASPTVSNLNNASLPLDRYTTTVDEYIELDYASKLMTSDCMKRFGVGWNAGSRLKLTASRDRSNRLGLVDEKQAARFGYHMDPATYSTRDKSDNPKLTDAQGAIMFGARDGKPARDGIPEGGCAGEGYRKVGWKIDDDAWLQELDNDAAMRTFADRRALEVLAKWSACMAESGYRYDKPEAAAADQRWWKDETSPATPAEKNTAVADVRCKKKINYLGTMTSILIAYQQQIVEGNLERLEAVRKQAQDALANAATVLNGR
ncbi:hypothetical protein AB0J83_28605 [Actinoplanes sp. NPDC049596]|uniref:hypothetical protein n=1 Tax=unclassified Actinoplanes TaxID=2626549 RepID=UPI00344702D4